MRTYLALAALALTACYVTSVPAPAPGPRTVQGPPGGYVEPAPTYSTSPAQGATVYPDDDVDEDNDDAYDDDDVYTDESVDRQGDAGYRRHHRHRGGSRGSPRKECRSEYGTTRCGYHCAAAYGQVGCAQTPMGACAADYGTLTCWDPPADVRAPYRDMGPAAECRAAYGRVVCGYHCVAEYGEVRCAETPAGVCTAAYGQVTCTD